jgi:hypothetical protein
VFKPAGIAIFVTVLLSTTAIAQTTPPEAKSDSSSHDQDVTNMLPPAVGDHWTYEIRDNISGDLKGDSTQTITDLKGDEISIQSHVLGAPASVYLIYDRSWDVKSNALWKYSPHDGGGIKDPMKEGQTWDIRTTDVKDARAMWKRTGASKVTGEESVTTQAGTFKAIKYETTVQIRGVIDPTKKAKLVVMTWYVPSVDHWVKRTEKAESEGHVRSNTTVELVDFGRQ